MRNEQMLEFITKSRRSTRKFLQKPVSEEDLTAVLEAGRYAPSGGNSQTCHFLVIQSREVLDKLVELTVSEFSKMEVTPNTYKSMANSINASKRGGYVFHYHAPCLIVVANKAAYGNNMADCSCALALGYPDTESGLPNRTSVERSGNTVTYIS